ncbi:hypothetical protein [Pseudomonas sp. B21-048]|uniref:hypothetical protein n=1 Tax=Pseudomonas sp. B21-048 TaxID=2895490 RepID=UPI00215F1E77|nr:hypothetical protein [Pseudomonas sp. B21-048]UVK96473.1 hypothetical protein LOY56_13670 [Pseudomonas sp. B21-048]
MSNQLKQGDLALTLLAGVVIPAMAEVEIDVFLKLGERAVDPSGKVFTAPFDGWSIWRDGVGCEFFKPEHLMPLRGDFSHEQQKSKAVWI